MNKEENDEKEKISEKEEYEFFNTSISLWVMLHEPLIHF